MAMGWPGGQRLDEAGELDVEVHLVGQLEVGGVEQDDVQYGREVLVVVGCGVGG